MKLNWYLFGIGFLLMAVLLTRLIQFGSNPIALYWDELAMGFDAYAIAQTGLDIHGHSWFQAILPSYGDFKAPFAIWLVSLSTYFFGLSPWSMRLPFLIMGYLGVLGMGLIIKELFSKEQRNQSNPTSLHSSHSGKGSGSTFKYDRYVCLLTLLFFMASPWHFHFSRIGFESGLSLNVLIWSMLLLIKGLKQHGGWLLFAATISGFSVYIYVSTRYIVPLFWLVGCLAFWRSALSRWRWLIPAIVLFALIQLPLYQSPFYQASQQYRWSVQNVITNPAIEQESSDLIYESGNSFTARILYHRYWFLVRAFLKNYLTHFTLSFWFLDGDPNLRHHSGWGGELLLVSLPIIFMGFYWLFNHLKHSVSWITIGWLLAAPFTAAIPYEVPHASRAIYMLIPITLLFAMGVKQGVREGFRVQGLGFRETLQAARRKPQFITCLVILALLINFGLYLEDYFNHYPQRSADAWQLGNTYIGKAVRKFGSSYNHIAMTSTYYLPINAVLFYNPEYILQIQAKARQQSTPLYTEWTKERFDRFTLIVPPRTEDLVSDTLYLTAPKPVYKPYVQAEYVYPDGTPALFVVTQGN